MKRLALDIETVENCDAVPDLFNALVVKAVSKIKLEVPKSTNPKPETLARCQRDYEEKVEGVPRKLREEAPLSPLLGRVACVTVCDPDIVIPTPEGIEPGVHTLINLESEAECLSEFIQWWDSHVDPKTQIITFNGRRFDIPFLGFRMAVHSFKPAISWPRPRDWARVIDVGEMFEGKLDHLLMACGIAPKVADGSDVKDMTSLELNNYTSQEMFSFVELVTRLTDVGLV